MAKTLTATDRSALIRLASTMEKGSPERRAILTGLKKVQRKGDKALAHHEAQRYATGPESVLSPGKASDHPEVKAFLKDMERAFKKHFPKGYFGARARTKFGQNSIYIATATLPKGQQANGIIQNDPSYNTFHMFGSYTDAGMNPRIKIEKSGGGMLMVLPAPDSYMAYDAVKIGWRNGTAKPAAIVKKFDQYFAKLAAAVNKAKREGNYPEPLTR